MTFMQTVTALKRNCSGIMALYVAVSLPVALTLTVIAVDFSNWHAENDNARQTAELIAMRALAFLPDRAQAFSYVQQEVAATHFTLTSTLTDFTPNIITVRLRSDVALTFLSTIAPLLEHPVTFAAHSSVTAQVVPHDTVIIISDGSSLRPKTPAKNFGAPSEWPESSYFTNCGLISTFSNTGTLASSVDWSAQEVQRWATQGCFNPVLSQLKLAAISLVDFVSAFPNNRTALVFTPGDATAHGTLVLRHLLSASPSVDETPGNTQPGGYFAVNHSGSEARWVNSFDPESMVSDAACVMFSYPDWASRYALPSAPSALQRDSTLPSCAAPINNSVCGIPYFPSLPVDACFLTESFQLREAIYWHSAKLSTGSFLARANLAQALRVALAELSTTNQTHVLEADAERALRGNLAFNAHRNIILLTDDLAGVHVPELSTLLEDIARAGAQLIVGTFFHSGMTPDYSKEHNSNIQVLQALINSKPHEISSKLTLLTAANENLLRTDVVPQIISMTRKGAIRQ